MKRKKLIALLGAATCFSALTVAVLLGTGGGKSLIKKANADPQTYTATLNNQVFALSGLTTTYQQSVTQQLGQDKPVMNYFLAKKDASNNLVLAPAGKVFNYSSSGTYKGRITDIISVTVSYSGGALYVQEGLAGQAETYGAKSALTSGVEKTLDQSPNYLVISNSNAETTITSISVKYSCFEAPFELERLGEKYLGKSKEGSTIELIRNGSSVSAAGQTGTIAVGTNGTFEISLASGAIVYSGMISSDYKTLTFTGKSGAGAGSAPTIAEMNRVYVMDDFESYADRGNGFTADATSIFSASNLRGAYFVDAGAGSGSTWVSGSTFKMPSTGNYLNLSIDGTGPVHGGSQAMLLQGDKSGWRRAWNSEVWNQAQHYNFGSGDRLSFWIHSARNNPDGTGVNSSNVNIVAQVYYENFALTDSSRNSTEHGTGRKYFTINTDTGWNQCVINIDPTKTVYAINIMVDNANLATSYVFMPIDDITIYTEPVYSEQKMYENTATRFTKSYKGTATVAGQNMDIKVGLGANGYTYAYAGVSMEATTYTINGNQIVIQTTGSYSGMTFGNWTGTLSNNNKTITIDKETGISGTIKSYVSTATIVLNETTVLADGSESAAVLMQRLGKQYNNGSWTNYDSLAGEFAPVSNYYIEGSSSIMVSPKSKIRVFAAPALAQSAGSVNDLSFWYYVPAGVKTVFAVYGLDTNEQPPASGHASQAYTVTYEADSGTSGWHYISMGLPNGYKKNGFIYIEASVPVYLDYLTVY